VDLPGKTVPRAAERISRQLIANKRKSFVNSPREHLAAYRIQRPEVENISAVFMFPKKSGIILNTLSDSLWLRVTATRRHYLCTQHRFRPEHQRQNAGTPPTQLIHAG
jgi:hypothetical protein